jgi:hypothetical protein
LLTTEEPKHALPDVVSPAQHEIDQEWNERSHQNGPEVMGQIPIDQRNRRFGICSNVYLLDCRRLLNLRKTRPAPACFGGLLGLLLNFLFLLAQAFGNDGSDGLILNLIQLAARLV